VRTAYFIQLNASPLIDMHRWQQSDMNYYDAWARTIASGDWLSRTITPPMHEWQRQAADEYLARHADVRDRLQRATQSPGSPDVETALWMQWMRTPAFYQDPLYIYMVAIVYRLTLADPRAAIALQLVSGVLSIALIWLVALRCFGDAVAAGAAAMAVLCAPLLFYEGLLLRDSLVALAGLALVWCIGRVADAAAERRTAAMRWAVVLGVCCGFAWLLKSTFVMIPFALVALALIAGRGEARRATALVVAMLAGFAVAPALLALRNSAVGAAPLSLASLGPFTFVTSNSATANPDAGWEVDTSQLAAFLGDTNGHLATAVRTALSGQTVGSYAGLLWRKWDRTWHWFEIPNNENLYYARRQIAVLRWLPITFWAISPLALVGLALAVRRVRVAWPLYLLVAFFAASLIGFVVLGRQRVPLLAALMPFAALTVVSVAGLLRRRQYGACLAVLVAVLAAGVWTGRPRSSDEFMLRTADWLLPFSVRYQPLADEAIRSLDWARAASMYREFFASAGPTTAEVAESDDPTLAPTLAGLHAVCAEFVQRSGGDPAGDIRETESLLEMSAHRLPAAGSLQPAVRTSMREAFMRLATLHRQLGHRDDALQAYRALIRLAPEDVEVRRGLAAQLLEGEHPEEAIEQYREILGRSPDDRQALTGLAIALANSGRLEDAVAAFRAVVRADPQDSHAHYNLARALAAHGDLAEALNAARRSAALNPADPAARALVAQLTRSGQGR
jgi:tetratricopeptide (TPR) repeat protein